MTTAEKTITPKAEKIKMVSLPVACALLDLGDLAYKACVRNGTLPRPMPYNTKSVGYPQHELDQLIEACNKGALPDEMQALVRRIYDSRSPTANNFKRFAV